MIARLASLLGLISLATLAGLVTPARPADSAHSKNLNMPNVTWESVNWAWRSRPSCTPVPTLVSGGRRGMGEPGTFTGRWAWLTPEPCDDATAR